MCSLPLSSVTGTCHPAPVVHSDLKWTTAANADRSVDSRGDGCRFGSRRAETRGDGCGTGTTTLRLAEAVRPTGRVLGIDISEQQLGQARQRVAAAGNVQLVLDDASTHGFAPQTIDLVFTRIGMMFFADPVAAFSNIRCAMKPGGRSLLAVLPIGGGKPVGDCRGRCNPSSGAATSSARTGRPRPVQLERSGTGSAYSRGCRIPRYGADPARPETHLGAHTAEAAEFATFIGQGARCCKGKQMRLSTPRVPPWPTSSGNMSNQMASVCLEHCGWCRHGPDECSIG